MKFDDWKIRKGSRLDFKVNQAEETSISATFIASNGVNTITATEFYVDGVAYFEIGSPDTDVEGVYEYQINENFPTGAPDKYPESDYCTSEECELPKLTICRSLD